MSRPPVIAPSSIVVQRQEPLSAQVGDRTVLMSVAKGKYYDLDAISSHIWQRLVEPVAVSALCTALAEEYAETTDVIQADVVALLSQFAEQGLIDVREERASVT